MRERKYTDKLPILPSFPDEQLKGFISMSCDYSNAGRVASEGSEAGTFWTFEQVEDRLVEALALWWRMPDADARFGLGGRISSIWSQYLRDRSLIDAHLTAEQPRRLPPSRADIARMQEATAWIAYIPERDRRMVMTALAALAGGAARVPWEKLWRDLGRGRPGPHGLRKRFDNAISIVAQRLNGTTLSL